MGSQLSQSQQLRNTFPLSQYKLLPSDKNFPQLTFLQKLSDSSVFAVKATDKKSEAYEPSNSKHVIKRVQKRQINKKLFELYEWANANVQGLVEYIHLVDKNRKISKSEFNAIVEGAVRGYNAVSKQCFQIECLQISMKKLRIFNEISLKNGSFNSKQLVNSINVKLIPKSLNQCLQKNDKNSEVWGHVGQCIHQGGILTEKQLLGQYLLQLSNYATKKDFKNKAESLKNLKASFGINSCKAVESLLANQDWKEVIKILETNFAEQSHSALKQIQNKLKTTQTIQFNNQKPHDTQKTIDTQNNKSQKVLFQCFRSQQKSQKNQPTLFQSPPKQAKFQTYVNIPNAQMERSRINSTQYYRSVSPIKADKFLSPPSAKIAREMSPVVTKVYQRPDDYPNIDNLKLTRTNSVLTIFPQMYRDQQDIRNRMLSTKNRPNMMFSPEGKKPQNLYQNSPRVNSPSVNSPRVNSPRYENKNQISQTNVKQIEKRKGKKIEFKPSKPNSTLKQISVPQYQWKIKVDKVEGSKKINQNNPDQRNRNDSFLSQQFSSLNFQLSDKYFLPSQNKNSKPSFFDDQKQKHNVHKSPKIQIKNNAKPAQSVQTETKNQNNQQRTQSQKVLHYPPRQNHHLSIEVKQANSETILFDPESNISFKKVDRVEVSPVNLEGKQSKYIGPVNMKGQKQGEGKLYFPSGGYYAGSFYKDFMHGQGKLYYPCGKLAYEGTFKYDKFHGSGKIYNQSPTFISSFDFRNFNKLEVTEKEQTAHKEHHLISAVQREKKISYWKFYEGEMSHDMKHGKGIMMLENGQKYEGEFKDDLVHGKGVFYGNNGKLSGRWQDNLLMEVYR